LTESLNQFAFTNVVEGQWIGEESLFSYRNTLNYTLRAKTKVTLLEIAIADLK